MNNKIISSLIVCTFLLMATPSFATTTVLDTVVVSDSTLSRANAELHIKSDEAGRSSGVQRANAFVDTYLDPVLHDFYVPATSVGSIWELQPERLVSSYLNKLSLVQVYRMDRYVQNLEHATFVVAMVYSRDEYKGNDAIQSKHRYMYASLNRLRGIHILLSTYLAAHGFYGHQ